MVEKSRATEVAYLPPAAPFHNEGKTLASWVTMAGITLGAIVAGFAVALASVWMFCVGAAVIVVSLVVGLVLRKLGFGQPSPGEDPRRSDRQRYQGDQQRHHGR